MDFGLHLHGLCERAGDAGLFAEPLNLLTSACFLWVGFALYRYLGKLTLLKNHHTRDIRLLIATVPLIGIASAVFHAHPTRLTEAFDIAVIVGFIVGYFISAIFRIVRCTKMQAVVAVLAYAGATHILVHQFPNALNDSIGYLSTMGALVFIALYLDATKRAASHGFLLAALTGCLSLFFRSVDRAACGVVPTGTHFLWHGLNALIIWLLMTQLIRSVTRKPKRRKRKQPYIPPADAEQPHLS